MADFNQPQNQTYYTLVFGYIRDMILSVAKMFDGTSDTNVPDGVIRYNSTANKFQKKNGAQYDNLGLHAPIDSHIADTALHSGFPAAGIVAWPCATLPDATWAWCDGAAYNRATYAVTYARLGGATSPWGQGDGSTTFNVPDFRGYTPIGKATSGLAGTLGAKFGSLSHTHTGPAHIHLIADHRHTMTHGHNLNDHTHVGGVHYHLVQAHYHSATATGATIAITSSGSHRHNIVRRAGGTYSGDDVVSLPASSGTTADGLTKNDSQSSHTHGHSAFTGLVGYAGTGAADGDNGFNTTTTGAVATSGVTGGPGATQDFTGNTGYATGMATASEGTGATGAANGPCCVINWIIKLG